MCDAPVLPDTVPGFRGPLAGILAGLEWTAAATRCRYMVSVAVDTPFFPLDLVERLRRTAGANPGHIALARSRGRTHPVFALWPIALGKTLARHLGADRSGRMMDFIATQGYVAVDFGDDAQTGADPFFNINTHEALAAARDLVAGRAP